MNFPKYDLTIQWTDESRELGYQETCETLAVPAASVDAAIEAARALRSNVTRVQVHGVAGTGIAFHGAAFVWPGRKIDLTRT